MNQKKLEQINKDLINKQFEIAGIDLDYDKLVELNPENWFIDNKMTVAQSEEFEKWAVDYISKKLRLPKFKGKRSARNEFSWWSLQYGLAISDTENLFKEKTI